MTPDVSIRRARLDDRADVVSFTTDTWAGRERDDYVPRVFDEWVAADGEDCRTVVVDVDGEAVGVARAALLSDHEAWIEGLRVAPDHRGAGHSMRLVGDVFEWASDRGATVARCLVFGWNEAGLGQTGAAGFDALASFRWARPDPAPTTPDAAVVDDPGAAWSCWTRSDARDTLEGLAPDRSRAWAFSELTREDLLALGDAARTFAVAGTGTRGMAARVRVTDDEDGGRVAVYGPTAWADRDAAAALLAAIRADAHALDADATRVLVPERPRHVAQVATTRTALADQPSFLCEADLTGAT